MYIYWNTNIWDTERMDTNVHYWDAFDVVVLLALFPLRVVFARKPSSNQHKSALFQNLMHAILSPQILPRHLEGGE